MGKEAKPKLSADARKGGDAAQNSILTLRTDAEVVMDPESDGRHGHAEARGVDRDRGPAGGWVLNIVQRAVLV